MPAEPQNIANATLLIGRRRVVELLTWFPSIVFPNGTFSDHDLRGFDCFYRQLFTPLLPAPTDCIEIIEVGLEQAFAGVITPDAVIRQSFKVSARKEKLAAFKAAPMRCAPVGRVVDG